MEEKRDSLIFYRSFYEAIKELSLENQGAIYNAIFTFGFDFKETELSGISKTVWTLIKPQIEANIRKYKNGKKAKDKQNGSKTEAKDKQNGSKTEAKDKQNGSKTEAKDKQNGSKTEANVNENDNDNVNENENENVKKIKKSTLLAEGIEKFPPLSDFEVLAVKSFISYQYKNKAQIKTLVDKNKTQYLEKSILEFQKLKTKYDVKQIIEVLQYITKDLFWQNQILSIHKLSKTNSDGAKYIDVMIDKINTPTKKSCVAFIPVI